LAVFRLLVLLHVMSAAEYRDGFVIYMTEAVIVPVISLCPVILETPVPRCT
jgi:hypothetical protein